MNVQDNVIVPRNRVLLFQYMPFRTLKHEDARIKVDPSKLKAGHRSTTKLLLFPTTY